jgi:Fic family protein
MRRVGDRRSEALDLDFLLDLHRTVSLDTLDDPSAVGRLRRADEDVRVTDVDGVDLHIPPPANDLPARLEIMCRFANGAVPDYFVHPALRAILLHFWLAYEHPFVDGNGRTARALFYWAMLRQGYWLAEYLSISAAIKKAPAQYARAFLLAETDENDVTYFLLHHLDVIQGAIRDLHAHVQAKATETRAIERRLRSSEDLNHRQMTLLAHALKHADASYTIEGHRRSHNVVHETARTDLFGLQKKGFLEVKKVGKTYVFHPARDLELRLSARQ